MFILKRQDVEISTIVHPKRDQPVTILHYQGQTFRLLSVFQANQEEEARALWRELTDGRGKACVLLEESDRYTVWGKIRLDQLSNDTGSHQKTEIFILASILLLQSVYIDIEDFLGSRQAGLFEHDMAEVLQKGDFPQVSSQDGVKYLLNINPQQTNQLPNWQEQHVITLLQELHRLAKAYFGNTNFAHQVVERLQDMPEEERSVFLGWLKQSSVGKLWH
ncbi:hypothetical protein G7B40_037015 [Aetokthonos hydrillicola Thurmond2011]|jgi:hypothetical protein|uniref:Uncharacterized protein n=1 Tax=Aetokthonos hydrillicola Thurmond2011 TaxID=2712845 RepID=A0AAP5IEE1_9CYAN|nr:Npun_F0813 family protein [Aetokthonos hydrillicola]MBO3459676.1 hypothetical protein [Aetokthonos hydrillicola CCALA 1050]MBW4589040.1 hypothetical protein [Aetokthonos hydrillicola CCALA 1050]MDR9900113.1 hypothetical protein [Aetokthonos hydrillicola Thurmond2011]